MQIESICERIIAEVLQAKQSLIASVSRLNWGLNIRGTSQQLTEQRDVKLQSFAVQHRQLQDSVPILQVLAFSLLISALCSQYHQTAMALSTSLGEISNQVGHY